MTIQSVSSNLRLAMAYGTGIEALADPTRRTIFERLGAGERSVGELAADLPVSRPAVSQHLKVLKTAGLVRERRAGTRRIYRVEPDGVAELRDVLRRVLEPGPGRVQGGRRARRRFRMSSTQMLVKRSIVVAATPEVAFRVFTEGHRRLVAGEDALRRRGARRGGRARAAAWADASSSGSTTEPSTNGVGSPSGSRHGASSARGTRAAAPRRRRRSRSRFTEEGGGTRVSLEQTGWEVLGDRAEEIRASYDSEGGWDFTLRLLRRRRRAGCLAVAHRPRIRHKARAHVTRRARRTADRAKTRREGT